MWSSKDINLLVWTIPESYPHLCTRRRYKPNICTCDAFFDLTVAIATWNLQNIACKAIYLRSQVFWGHIHFWSLDAVAFKYHLRESKNKGDSTRRAVLSISGISHHQARSGAADWLHSRGSRWIMGDFAEIVSRKNRVNIVSKGTRNRASEHFDNCLHCSSSTFPTFRSFRAAKLYVLQSKTREKLNWRLFPMKISSKPNFGVNSTLRAC